MMPSRLVFQLCLVLILSSNNVKSEVCVDLISTCSSLQGICIGSILAYHFEVISGISDQVNGSSMPALENSLPVLESGLPLLTSSQNSSTESSVEAQDEALKNALPLLKESLPLIRESLPLIRESLPLIRQYLDPFSSTSGCQRKATCRSCKECPKLRESIVAFVESVCPNTCKVCSKAGSLSSTTAGLVGFF